MIVAGCRTFGDTLSQQESISSKIQEACTVFSADPENVEIVTGGARGVDQNADIIAGKLGYGRKVFPADWDRYGKKAGPVRNRQMADYLLAARADHIALLAFWDGKSPGTRHMIKTARELGIKVFVVRFDVPGYDESPLRTSSVGEEMAEGGHDVPVVDPPVHQFQDELFS